MTPEKLGQRFGMAREGIRVDVVATVPCISAEIGYAVAMAAGL
jgi:hypothetical protein